MENVKKIIERLENHLSNESYEKDIIIEQANDLLNNYIYFDDEWYMEPCSNKVVFENWNQIYNNDIEWNYMLNRLEYLDKLILADLIFDTDDRYYKKWIEYIMSWVDYFHNNQLENYRTLDTAIRIQHMAIGITIFKYENKIEECHLLKIIKCIRMQMEDLLKEINTDFKLKSNWGIIEICGLIYTDGLLNTWGFKNIQEDQLYKLLIKMIQKQILDDGGHVECSFMYEVQIYRSLALILNDIKEECVKKIIKEKLKDILHFLVNITNTNNQICNFGDSDITDISSLIHIGNSILMENYSNYIKKSINANDLLYYNVESANYDKQFEKERYALFKSSGIFCFNGEDYFLLTSNCNAEFNSGHKHLDDLSFILIYKYKEFFVDSGRLTYKNSKLRRKLKKFSSHNTFVNSALFNPIILNSWKTIFYSNQFKSTYFQKINKQDFFLVLRIKKNKIRKLIYIHKYNLFIIIDFGKLKGIHKAVNHLILDEKVLINQNHKKNSFKLINQNVNLFLDLFECDSVKIKKTILSKRYNEKLESRKIISSKLFINKFYFITTITPFHLCLKKDETKNEINLNINNDYYLCIKKANNEVFLYDTLTKEKKLIMEDGEE